MRTKMSCSDGRATSKWRTGTRATIAGEQRLRIAGEPQLLKRPRRHAGDARQRLSRRPARRLRPAPCRCRSPTGSRRACRRAPSPRKIMKMRSHIRSATFMSCVLKTMVVPLAETSRIASRSTSALTGSRPENGSSRITSWGRETTAAMNCTFWAMPFESASMASHPARGAIRLGRSTWKSRGPPATWLRPSTRRSSEAAA